MFKLLISEHCDIAVRAKIIVNSNVNSLSDKFLSAGNNFKEQRTFSTI